MIVKKKNVDNTNRPIRRRQERGQRRMSELLDAAAELFAEVDYERATTNSIAERAGVSPGTLYQFFSNKQDLAEALASRYAERLRQAQEAALDVASAKLPLPDLVDRIVDPFLAFHRQEPGFEALLTSSVISSELKSSIGDLECQIEGRLVSIFTTRCPKADRKQLQAAAATSVRIFKSLMRYCLSGTPKEQRDRTRELKAVLERYFTPILVR